MGSSECHWGRLHGRHSDLSGSGTPFLARGAFLDDSGETRARRGDMVRALAVDARDLFVLAHDAKDAAYLAEMAITSMAGGGADNAPRGARAGGGEVAKIPTAAALDVPLVGLDEFGYGIASPSNDDIPDRERDSPVIRLLEIEEEVGGEGGGEVKHVRCNHPAGAVMYIISGEADRGPQNTLVEVG